MKARVSRGRSISWLGATGAIARLFFRRFSRQPITVAFTLLVPFALAYVFGTADARAASQIPIGALMPANHFGAGFLDAIGGEPGVRLERFHSHHALQLAISRGDVAAGLAVTGGAGPARFAVPLSVALQGNPEDPLFGAARAIVWSVAVRTEARGASTATVFIRRVPTTARAQSTGYPRAAAGMLVFFVFTSATGASIIIASDRQLGVLHRIGTMPVRLSAVVAGEVSARFGTLLVQAIVIAAGSSVLFGTTWGALVPFAMVLVAMAAVAAGVSVLFGSLQRRPDPEVAATGAALAAVTGLLGGCFWSLSGSAAALRVLGHFTPQAWVLDATNALAARGAGVAGVAVDLFVLAAFAAVLGVLASLALRRSIA